MVAPEPSGDRPPVALLGGSSNTVSVARALGRLGAPVHAVGELRGQVAYSRYCRSFTLAGSRESVQPAWLAWVLETARPGTVVLACDDDGLELVARNRQLLVDRGLKPFEANDDVLLETLDKERTAERARELGIPVPRSIRVRTSSELRTGAASFELPFLLKPAHGHVFRRTARVPPVKALVIETSSDLDDASDLLDRIGIELTLSEIVTGADDRLYFYSTYIDEHGTPLTDYVERQLRQYPPGYGVACYRITAQDREIAELGRRFLLGLGARGLVQLEFKRDARDETPKLIECNHRFGAGNELTRLAGIDLARLAYTRLAGLAPPDVAAYRIGVRMWHPVDDLRSFLAMRRAGSLSTGAWLTSLGHRMHFAVFRWDDPMPTLAYFARRAAERVRPGG